MAGLDKRRASDFIGMLQQLGGKDGRARPVTEDPVQLCSEAIKTCQMASESLLLRERDAPLSKQSYAGCCDTVVAKGKELSLAAENLESELVGRRAEGVCRQLALLAEAVCVVTETTAQAVFMVAEKTPGCKKAVPGAVDMYVLNRGRLAVETAAAGFSRDTTGQDQMLAIAAVIATHLELIREEVLNAAAKLKAKSPHDAGIFTAAANALSGNAAVLVAAIKAFAANPSKEARTNAHLFTRPTIASLDALISFSTNEKFIGVPPQVRREVADYIKPMQAAAMSLVSGTTLMIGAAKNALTNPSDRSGAVLVTRYRESVTTSMHALLVALKAARDAKLNGAKMMYEDPK
eukprot:m.446043 g.446043  ORF g.446043 m.446043 type:complete len:349 (+) comp19304_c0_seq1:265-1311(+)